MTKDDGMFVAKVEVIASSSAGVPEYMRIFNQAGTRGVESPMTESVRRKLAGRPSAFFVCRVAGGTIWVGDETKEGLT